jgi:hypothetical protein
MRIERYFSACVMSSVSRIFHVKIFAHRKFLPPCSSRWRHGGPTSPFDKDRQHSQTPGHFRQSFPQSPVEETGARIRRLAPLKAHTSHVPPTLQACETAHDPPEVRPSPSAKLAEFTIYPSNGRTFIAALTEISDVFHRQYSTRLGSSSYRPMQILYIGWKPLHSDPLLSRIKLRLI